ncbi:helix-turn-helix transcriptional regulator [Verrucosispora sp. NA02020]|uniref:helix-turn-helix transcriptional regulator n=1 Tax=Verrucosispora sp. NA02020 TaxID=2742132 RepID=UPI00159039D4|nr:helix-turn-helix transcriptional regulator [Verrucosispora sp. NA02020]QKW15340.1 helix-turn-helix domain-containing protein [Verrucosispora sp. NA02020]
MRTIPDLHPDDTSARDHIAGWLRRIRENRHISQAEAADRYGCNEFAISQMESRRSWHVATVQAWARIYDYRIQLTALGLTVPDDGDPMAAMYEHTSPSTAAAEDRLDLRIYVNNLARIRRASRISLATLGARMGCTEGAVSRRESNPDRVRVSTLQRHTRALGGVLDLSVVPTWQGAAA